MAALAGVATGGAPLALAGSVAALLLITALRPADGLLLLAAFGPLGGALGALVPYRDGWTIPILLAFTAGYARAFWVMAFVAIAGAVLSLVLVRVRADALTEADVEPAEAAG